MLIDCTGITLDAEQFARNHLTRMWTDFAAFLSTNYTIQEKQAAREQIRQATAQL
jgi:hypothetical protein